jgi:hypothetical protein
MKSGHCSDELLPVPLKASITGNLSVSVLLFERFIRGLWAGQPAEVRLQVNLVRRLQFLINFPQFLRWSSLPKPSSVSRAFELIRSWRPFIRGSTRRSSSSACLFKLEAPFDHSEAYFGLFPVESPETTLDLPVIVLPPQRQAALLANPAA